MFYGHHQENPSLHLNNEDSAKVRLLSKVSKYNIPHGLLVEWQNLAMSISVIGKT